MMVSLHSWFPPITNEVKFLEIPIGAITILRPVPKDELLMQISRVRPVVEGLKRVKKMKPLEALAKAVAGRGS